MFLKRKRNILVFFVRLFLIEVLKGYQNIKKFGMSRIKEKREKKEMEIIDEESNIDFQDKENENKYYSIEDKIDDIALDVFPKLKDYIRDNGLCIGEYLEHIDIMNLVEHIYK